MGQQVVTIAGQVIGGYLGGLVGVPYIGAAIGGAIGAYAGNALFGEDQIFEGPRLSDLKIQTSNYGNAVPILYGTVRVAGNVIWSTDIRETRTETEQGKGGPDTTQVDYQYDLDVAVGLGDPPIGFNFEGCERIYANGVLIYDTRAGASPQNVFASGLWATGTTLYPGTEVQLPDPTMEAALGVGNVPAYRGHGYIVIPGLKLNVLRTSVMPNFEFVVSTSATIQLGQQLKQVPGLMPVYHFNNMAYIDPTPIVSDLTPTVRVANNFNDLVRVYDLNGVYQGTEPRNDEELFGLPAYAAGAQPFNVWITFDQRASISTLNLAIGSGAVFTIGGFDMLSVVPSTDILRGIVASADQRHYLILTSVGSTNINEWFLIEWDGSQPVFHERGTVDTTGMSINEANDWNASPVYQRPAAHYVSMMESDLTHLWQVDHGNVAVWKIESAGSPSTRILSRIIYFSASILPLRNMAAAGASLAPAIYADNGLAAMVVGDADGDQSWYFLYSRFPQVTPSGIFLTDILTDLCERSELDTTTEVSFVNLAGILVDGFAIGQTMTARSAIEVLQAGFYFDAVDSDTFKFVKRGGASVIDIDYDDLGAGPDAATIHAVSVNRRQETEIPARINVKYLSVAADYQVAVQSARRETTGSREIAEVNLPIVFEDDNKAAEIADILLRERWAGAFTRTFATTIEYAKYEPTDVIRLDDGAALRTVRLRSRADRNSLIEWESIDEDVEAYDSNAIAAHVAVPAQELITQGPSDFAVLDIPPLTELPEGNESAAKVAAKGYLSPWSGAGIDISRDDGTTYTPGTSVTQASVMGAALTALDNFLGGNVFDGASTVRVDVGAGTLSSATTDEVYDGANLSYLASELLQFKTATLVSTGVYDLTDFLRARKGTEQYLATHAIGDRFVLISGNLRDLPLNLADRAIDNLLVRATTGSMSTSSGVVRSFDPVIARLMPYSPVQLTAVRDSLGGWYLDWERRDRYNNDWNDLVDVAMSEAAELYDVEIYNDAGDLAGTYTDISDSFLDVDASVLGGSPTPDSITFSVWQKSALVGRGFEANETITQAL